MLSRHSFGNPAIRSGPVALRPQIPLSLPPRFHEASPLGEIYRECQTIIKNLPEKRMERQGLLKLIVIG